MAVRVWKDSQAGSGRVPGVWRAEILSDAYDRQRAEWDALVYDDAPGHEMDRHVGVCHICQSAQAITYCSWCGHWVCRACRHNYFGRPIAAVKQKFNDVLIMLHIQHKSGPCCGPTKGATDGE